MWAGDYVLWQKHSFSVIVGEYFWQSRHRLEYANEFSMFSFSFVAVIGYAYICATVLPLPDEYNMCRVLEIEREKTIMDS